MRRPPEAFRPDPLDDFERDMAKAERLMVLVCLLSLCVVAAMALVFWL